LDTHFIGEDVIEARACADMSTHRRATSRFAFAKFFHQTCSGLVGCLAELGQRQ